MMQPAVLARGLMIRLSQQRQPRRAYGVYHGNNVDNVVTGECWHNNHYDGLLLLLHGRVRRLVTTSTFSSRSSSRSTVTIHSATTTTTTTNTPTSNNKKYSTKPSIPSSSSSSSVLQNEINRAGFQIFQQVSDNGYVYWRPPQPPPHLLVREQHGYYSNLSKITSAKEITDCIVRDGKPERLVYPLSNSIQESLPRHFLDLSPVKYVNKFPYGQHEIASLHVAVKDRGVDLVNDVDFCFGGSTLEMLAKRSNDTQKPYMASRIPGTRRGAILIVNQSEYVADLAAIGYQFERFMTGKHMAPHGQHGMADSVDHLQVMQVGKYHVLFMAETDAMMDNVDDGTTTPVEIKLSNPRHSSYWGTKVMFQMMSSGSTKICQGIQKDGQLVSVSLRSLSNVAEEALFLANKNSTSGGGSYSSAVHELEENILEGMDSIVSEMNKALSSSSLLDGDNSPVFQISFANNNDKSLKLLPVSGREGAAILPPSRIVRELVVN